MLYVVTFGVENVIDGLLVTFQGQAAKSQAVVSVRPAFLDSDRLLELAESLLVLAELLESARQVEDGGLVVLVQLEGLTVALERLLILLHGVQHDSLMVPVVRLKVRLGHLRITGSVVALHVCLLRTLALRPRVLRVGSRLERASDVFWIHQVFARALAYHAVRH